MQLYAIKSAIKMQTKSQTVETKRIQFPKKLALRTGSGYYRAINKVSNGKDRPGRAMSGRMKQNANKAQTVMQTLTTF